MIWNLKIVWFRKDLENREFVLTDLKPKSDRKIEETRYMRDDAFDFMLRLMQRRRLERVIILSLGGPLIFTVRKIIFPFLWKIKKSGNLKRRNVQHGKVVNLIAIIEYYEYVWWFRSSNNALWISTLYLSIW